MVMVRDRSSSHSPHHAMVGGQERGGGWGRLARRRARTRAGLRTPSGFCEMCGIRFSRVQPDASAASMAGIRISASFLPTLQGSGKAASTLVASAAGSVGGSNGGFKGSRFGTPVGSRSGTGGWMGCLGVVEVVAGGSLCSGVVELRPAGDEACGFQFLQRSHDGGSPGTGFGHQWCGSTASTKSLHRPCWREGATQTLWSVI